MTDELKLKLIQRCVQTYYEAGGSTLPSAYKSAMLDMIDTVCNLETAKNPKIVKTKWGKVKETENDDET